MHLVRISGAMLGTSNSDKSHDSGKWHIQNTSGNIHFNSGLYWAQELSSFTIGNTTDSVSENYVDLEVPAKSKEYRFHVKLFERDPYDKNSGIYYIELIDIETSDGFRLGVSDEIDSEYFVVAEIKNGAILCI